MKEPSASAPVLSTTPPPATPSPLPTSLHESVSSAFFRYFLYLTLYYPFWLYRLYFHGSQLLGESPTAARFLARKRVLGLYGSVILILGLTYFCMFLVDYNSYIAEWKRGRYVYTRDPYYTDAYLLVPYIPGNLVALTILFWGGNKILRLVQEIAEKCGVVTQPAQRFLAHFIGMAVSVPACVSMVLSPLCFIGWLLVAQNWLNRAIKGDSRAY